MNKKRKKTPRVKNLPVRGWDWSLCSGKSCISEYLFSTIALTSAGIYITRNEYSIKQGLQSKAWFPACSLGMQFSDLAGPFACLARLIS